MAVFVGSVGNRLPILLGGVMEEPPEPFCNHTKEYLSTDYRQWRALKSNVVRFWAEHGEGYRAWWAALTAQNKRALLKVYPQALSLVMPERRVDALQSFDDAVRVCPELNVQALISTGDRSLPSLYEKWCRGTVEADLAETRALVKTWMDAGRFEGLHPRQFVVLEDLPSFPAGHVFECEGRDALASVRAIEERGTGMRKDLVNLANYRLNKIFCALALYADGYRKMRLWKGDILVASPLRGCAQCARMDSRDGRELQGCRGCVEKTSVMFCGKECQRVFFASHLSNCVRLKDDAARGRAHSCQVCGAEKSEDGKKLRTCANCADKCAKYCSKECQKVAWKAGHKRECKVS